MRQIEVDAGDGVAHVLGLIDQRLALIGELAEQVADAHFVVVVGALERGDFVVHQRFQLGGAGKRALDAVAHGGDFAADGLADGDDLLARGGFRLRQPHRHLGHGLGDQTQVLRAAEHVGDRVEDNHRHGDGADEPDDGGNAAARGGEQGLQFPAIEKRGSKRAGGPDESRNAGDDIRRARRAAVHGLQYSAEIGAVVIGGLARRRLVGFPSGRLRLLPEQVGGRRRGLHGIVVGGGRSGGLAGPRRLAGAERFPDGAQRLFGRIGGFLRDIRHFGCRLAITPDCRGPSRHPLQAAPRAREPAASHAYLYCWLAILSAWLCE